jgi:hypothetical protein
MERVAWKQKLAFQIRRPAGLDKLKIKPLVRPINFVADDGMT